MAPRSFIVPLLEGINASAKKGIVPDMGPADLKGAAGTVYIAGQDTSSGTLSIFLLNMVLNPGVQLKAQNELDFVIGFDRLPTLEDRPLLPYIECVMQETLRWHPVVPLGIPHKSLDDDIYQGMFIPKGSIVFANAWSMCHDEAIYEDPTLFNPDRYAPISEGGNGEPHPIGPFGFGRRICVGRHLAESTLWISVATILATLTIGKEIGPNGQEIPPKVEFTSGLTSHAEAFKCTIRPRSKHAEDMVMSSVAVAAG